MLKVILVTLDGKTNQRGEFSYLVSQPDVSEIKKIPNCERVHAQASPVHEYQKVINRYVEKGYWVWLAKE
ncbi:hypothetical protein VCHA31O73_360029 [Vibrio chagasii]|nr:hypothetical protein VCHA31O73_360029 [Vibrio chagasii]